MIFTALIVNYQLIMCTAIHFKKTCFRYTKKEDCMILRFIKQKMNV